jgi:uncharacterized membrane protein
MNWTESWPGSTQNFVSNYISRETIPLMPVVEVNYVKFVWIISQTCQVRQEQSPEICISDFFKQSVNLYIHNNMYVFF